MVTLWITDRMSPSLIPSVIPMTTAVTRVHSSRMRTDRLLTASQHALPGGYLPEGVPTWGVYLPGEYLPGVCTCPGGVPAGGVYLPGGSCTRWGYLPRGMYLLGGVYLPEGGNCPGTTPPPVNRVTDRCKNITLPQSSFAGGNNGHGLEQRYVLTDHWIRLTVF